MYNECLSEKILSKKPYPMVDVAAERAARVLLIEDDRSMRRMASAGLRNYCDVIEAPDASQGITSYNSYQPDIVFMDIELPDGDGHNLLTWILHNDPGAFVVMFSGHYNTDNIIKSIDIGAKGFIAKPFDLSKMLHFVNLCPKLH